MKAHKILMLGILAVLLVSLIGIASAVTIKDISKNPQEVAPGKSINVKIELENNLDNTAEDVSVSLDLSSVPFSPETSSESFIEEIRESKTKYAEFDLIADADAEAGSYKVPITLSYKIGDVASQRTAFISIVINAKPNLIVTSETNLITGQNNKLDIKITNTGLAKAKFLSIALDTSTAYKILSPNSVYIGDLASDEFDTASFDVLINANQISIPVTVTYKDMSNNDYTEKIEVPIKSYSKEQAVSLGLVKKSNLIVYAGIVVTIILVIIIYRKIKKRKNSRR